MSSRTHRPRRRPLLAAGTLTITAALALPTLAQAAPGPASTGPASTRSSVTRHTPKKKRRTRRRTPAKPLTNAQILALIKKNEKPGPQGPAGPTGAAGASAGFAAIGSGGPLSMSQNTPTTVVSKGLPAGNFLVNAKVVLSGSATNPSSTPIAIAECDLFSSTSSGKFDSAQWDQPLAALTANVYAGNATLAAQAAVSLAAPASMSLQCYSSSPSVPLTASYASLQAVQVATAG